MWNVKKNSLADLIHDSHVLRSARSQWDPYYIPDMERPGISINLPFLKMDAFVSANGGPAVVPETAEPDSMDRNDKIFHTRPEIQVLTDVKSTCALLIRAAGRPEIRFPLGSSGNPAKGWHCFSTLVQRQKCCAESPSPLWPLKSATCTSIEL